MLASVAPDDGPRAALPRPRLPERAIPAHVNKRMGHRVNAIRPREGGRRKRRNRVKLVVTEKNDAAQKIADLLGVKRPKADKVYSTPVYRFDVDGEEWVTIGLRGHILEPDFTPTMVYKKRGGWQGVTEAVSYTHLTLPTKRIV